MQQSVTVGIMGAMEEEVALLKSKLKNISSEIIAQREYIKGKLYDIDTVLVFSRWGKVASSSTATTLITKYNIDCLIFTGAAGAISHELKIGDIVIANELYQHDMDARHLFEQHEIPLTGVKRFKVDDKLKENSIVAAENFLLIFILFLTKIL